MLISQGFRDKVPQTGWFQTEFGCLTVLEFRSSKSRRGRATLPLNPGGEPFRLTPSLADWLRRSSFRLRHCVAFFLCVCLHVAKDTSHVGLGPAFLHDDLILTHDIGNGHISKHCHIARYWGLGLRNIFFGGDAMQLIV